MSTLATYINLFARHLATVLIVISTLSILNLHAETSSSEATAYLPEYYPVYFEHAGLVTKIDKKNHQLVFGLVKIYYDSNVQVATLTSQFGTVDSLQAGDEIGYETVDNSGQLKIIRIWQLSSGSVVRP